MNSLCTFSILLTLWLKLLGRMVRFAKWDTVYIYREFIISSENHPHPPGHVCKSPVASSAEARGAGHGCRSGEWRPPWSLSSGRSLQPGPGVWGRWRPALTRPPRTPAPPSAWRGSTCRPPGCATGCWTRSADDLWRHMISYTQAADHFTLA